MACNEECAFFTSDVYYNYILWSCQKVCDALVYRLDNIFIRFGTKHYRQTIGILMGTNWAPLVADLFRFCYERDFMKSLSRENQADIIQVLVLRLPRLGKRKVILVLFVRLFGLCLFRFVGFLFLLGSGKGCGL